MALISVENVTAGLEHSPVHLCVPSSSEICMTAFSEIRPFPEALWPQLSRRHLSQDS